MSKVLPFLVMVVFAYQLCEDLTARQANMRSAATRCGSTIATFPWVNGMMAMFSIIPLIV